MSTDLPEIKPSLKIEVVEKFTILDGVCDRPNDTLNDIRKNCADPNSIPGVHVINVLIGIFDIRVDCSKPKNNGNNYFNFGEDTQDDAF